MTTATATITLPRYNVAQHAREGGYATIARYGGEAVAARARQGMTAKWTREIDPLGLLDPRELARRLEARMRQHMAKVTAARKAKAAARRAGLAETVAGHVAASVCSWCHPYVADLTHKTCPRHERTFDAMVAYARARHAGVIGDVA